MTWGRPYRRALWQENARRWRRNIRNLRRVSHQARTFAKWHVPPVLEAVPHAVRNGAGICPRVAFINGARFFVRWIDRLEPWPLLGKRLRTCVRERLPLRESSFWHHRPPGVRDWNRK